jgi:hypothetical protein
MFFNEIDILKIRLAEIYDIVDHIILVEATKTHSGKDKPLYYNENKHLFSQYQDKIIHLITDYSEQHEFCKYITAGNEHWYRENYQREYIQVAIAKLNLADDDIIVTTDCDEIPDCNILKAIKLGHFLIDNERVFSLKMTLYYYTIEYTTERKWSHPKLLNYATYKMFPLLTQIRFHWQTFIENAGWHLSFFGDVDFIKNKVESFAESVEYSEQGKSLEHLQKNYDEKVLHFSGEKLIHVPLAENPNVPKYFLNH